MNQLPMLSATQIAAERVLLRDPDREGLIELRTDPEVTAYIGGPLPREGVEQFLDGIGGAANATATPGTFIIADKATDDLLGTFELKRRPVDWPGHVTDDSQELELGYLMRCDARGAGLAFEAAAAVCVIEGSYRWPTSRSRTRRVLHQSVAPPSSTTPRCPCAVKPVPATPIVSPRA
ncbi:GNAT family N-acetyltransferase [Nocardia sp. NPDC059246]|uniref:GNAT family N-acetyltransferase n=1 Tax=unclassified Nocardia TaxID=2637762 RepID=UPI003680E54F